MNNLLNKKKVLTATTPDLSLRVVETCSRQYSSIWLDNNAIGHDKGHTHLIKRDIDKLG